tara:strand:- start:123 stop:848 length:726 start_codon:yes stop_codon:yes gene_type:complete
VGKSVAIILAAGKGSRMKNSVPKPLIEVFNKPMIEWIIDKFNELNIDVIVVINPKDESFFKKYTNIKLVYQIEQRGTGHAVQQAISAVDNYESVFVFVGDSPFVKKNKIESMLSYHNLDNNDVTILSSIFKNKYFPYARVVRCSKNNKIRKIIEEFEASKDELLVKELFCSHYLFKTKILKKYLPKLVENYQKKEIFLADIFKFLINDNRKIESVLISNWKSLIGLNSKGDIHWIESQEMS